MANEASSFEPLSVGVSLPKRQHILEDSCHYAHRKHSELTTKDYIAENSLDNVSPVTRHLQVSLRHQSSIEKE